MKACSKRHYVLFEGVSVRALDEATLVLVETAGSVLLSVEPVQCSFNEGMQ